MQLAVNAILNDYILFSDSCSLYHLPTVLMNLRAAV